MKDASRRRIGTLLSLLALGGSALIADVALDRRILPVVGSTPGANGTFFRTSVQLSNPGSTPMTGRLVFRPSGAAGRDTDPALSYSLTPGETLSIADLLPAIGVSGLGSADIEITSGGVPVVSARVFNDAGPSGTAGFTEEAMDAFEALHTGSVGVLLIPPDLSLARFNVGIRTLDEGASVTFTLRNAAGAVFGSSSRAFPADYHEQQSAAELLRGLEVPAGGSISIALLSGAAIVYGAAVDNITGDAGLQVGRSYRSDDSVQTPTHTPTPTPTETPTPTGTRTSTPTRTRTPRPTGTRTPTPSTRTPTLTPTGDACKGCWDY